MNKQIKLLYLIITGLVIIIIVLVYLYFFNQPTREGKIYLVYDDKKEYKLSYGPNNDVTFTNYAYNYKITIPDDWSVDDVTSLDTIAFFDELAQQQEIVTELLQGMKLEIISDSYAQDNTLEQAIDATIESMDDSVLSRDDTYVDNRAAIKIKTDIMGYSVTTYVRNKGVLYYISGYIGELEDKEKYEAKYSSILSTFRFIE